MRSRPNQRRCAGFAFAFALTLLLGAAEAGCPSVGAIRWDAWHGPDDAPGRAVEATLGPERWRSRLPECGREEGQGRVSIDCINPRQIEREMREAVQGGIDFWAFVVYEEDSPMSRGLQLYLRSSHQPAPRFALVSGLSQWGSSRNFAPSVERFVKLMASDRYQRIDGDRPLLFLGFLSERELTQRYGREEGFSEVLAALRRQTRERLGVEPYLVLMEGDPARAARWQRLFGFDAVTSYAIAGPRTTPGTFADLTALAEQRWSRWEALGVPFLPNATTGWDRRPRVEHPVPWEPAGSAQDMQNYFAAPTPAQLQAHLERAMAVAGRGRGPEAVLIYAWNEFDEGGWLAPTRGDGASRLQAVRAARRAACER